VQHAGVNKNYSATRQM